MRAETIKFKFVLFTIVTLLTIMPVIKADDSLRMIVELNREYFPILLSMCDERDISDFENVSIALSGSTNYTLYLMLKGQADLVMIPSDVFLELALQKPGEWAVAAVTSVDRNAIFFPLICNRFNNNGCLDQGGGFIGFCDPDALRLMPVITGQLRKNGVITKPAGYYPDLKDAVSALQAGTINSLILSPEKYVNNGKVDSQLWNMELTNPSSLLEINYPWYVLAVKTDISSSKRTIVDRLKNLFLKHSKLAKSDKKGTMARLKESKISSIEPSMYSYWLDCMIYRNVDETIIQDLKILSAFMKESGFISEKPSISTMER